LKNFEAISLELQTDQKKLRGRVKTSKMFH